MGRGKNSLTEQQSKWTVTTIILKRRQGNSLTSKMPSTLPSTD